MKASLEYTISPDEAVQPERLSTGVKGLDDMLGGGLPSKRCVLVCGGPGSGKTIFGIQFLCNGVTKYGETGLYITLDESPSKLSEDMAAFGWNLERLCKDNQLVIVDASPLRTIPADVKVGNFTIHKKDFSMLSLTHIIKNKAQEINAKRLVIDPITMFVLQYPEITERRNAIVNLFEGLADLGTTNLLTSELRVNVLEREIQPEEFLSDGVLVFHSFVDSGRVVKAIQIEKMRGISHDHELRPYKIVKHGIEVFARERIYK